MRKNEIVVSAARRSKNTIPLTLKLGSDALDALADAAIFNDFSSVEEYVQAVIVGALTEELIERAPDNNVEVIGAW